MFGGSGRILPLIGIGLALVAFNFGKIIRTNQWKSPTPHNNDIVAVRPIDSREEYYAIKIREALFETGRTDRIESVVIQHSDETDGDVLKLELHMGKSDFNQRYPRESILRDVRVILDAMKNEAEVPLLRVKAYMPMITGKKESLVSDLIVSPGEHSSKDWSKTSSAEILEACVKVWFRDGIY